MGGLTFGFYEYLVVEGVDLFEARNSAMLLVGLFENVHGFNAARSSVPTSSTAPCVTRFSSSAPMPLNWSTSVPWTRRCCVTCCPCNRCPSNIGRCYDKDPARGKHDKPRSPVTCCSLLAGRPPHSARPALFGPTSISVSRHLSHQGREFSLELATRLWSSTGMWP